MKTKTYILLLFVFTLFQSSKAQVIQTAVSSVENHLNGELDYTHETLYLVQKQQTGEEIIIGEITKEGTIHLSLPEFDIKALYDSIPLQPQNFFSMFLMNSDCKDRDLFAETPFNDVYAQKFDPIYIKKYDEDVAILFPATDEKMFKNNDYYGSNSYDGKVLTLGSKFYWFYMDREIMFNDACTKNLIRDNETIQLGIASNLLLKKGWNFIEEKLVETQVYSQGDYTSTLPKKIAFSIGDPNSKKVKWYLIQVIQDDRLEKVKTAYEIEPLTRSQYENALPEKAGNFTRTNFELDKALERSSSTKNNAYAVFEYGNQKMEIAMLDGAKNPEDLEMVNFSFAMDEEYERDDKPVTDATENEAVTKGEPHHISKEDTALKTAQVMSLFNDRIVVYAKGENITATQLWEGIKTLNIGSILE